MLEVRKISVHYGPVTALNDISFVIEPGAVSAVVGANGAGKSSLMKAISGLVRVTEGQILLDGKDITQETPDARVACGVALSPEGRRLFPELTVYENLLMGAYLRKDKAGIKEDIDVVFEYFPRLRERISSQGRHLSGGEQQMCAIGRALMSRPRLLLLDEPSLGLAPAVTLEVAKAIRMISASGTTILLVEQNARLALKLSSTGLVIETGRMVMHGPSAEILQNPDIAGAYLGRSDRVPQMKKCESE